MYVRSHHLILASALIAAGLLKASDVVLPDRPVPPHVAWWRQPPQRDSFVRALWHFDSADLDSLLDDVLGGGGKKERTVAGSEPESEVRYERLGDVRYRSDGFFGGALTLGERSGIRIQALSFSSLASAYGRAGLECFVRLSEAEARPLLTVAEGRWTVEVREGQLQVRTGDQVVLQHPDRIVPNRWWYFAIGYYPDGRVALGLDGRFVTAVLPSSVLARSAPGREKGEGVLIGGGADEKGFRGDLDELLVVVGLRYLYPREADAWCDPAAARPLTFGPPFFSATRFVSRVTFDSPESEAGLPSEAREAGVRGSALRAWTVSQGYRFPIRGAQWIRRGTLEFWMQPMGWNNFYRSTDFFGSGIPVLPLMQIRLAGPEPKILREIRIQQGAGGKDFTPATRLVPLHPGRWTHVVVTWSPQKTEVFLDGVLQEYPQVMIHSGESGAWGVFKEAEQKGVADRLELELRILPTQTLVDEVGLYDWTFHPREVQNARNRFFPEGLACLEALPPVEAVFDYLAGPWTPGGERLDISLRALPVEERVPVEVDLEVLDEAGAHLVASLSKVALDENGFAEARLPGRFDFGRYPVRIYTRDKEGKPLAVLTNFFVWDRPPWYQNTLGLDRFVPPPWIPIERKKANQLLVWGRTIELGEDGLPSAIESQGRPLLKHPIRIQTRLAGQEPKVFQGRGVVFEEQSSDRVTWAASCEGGISGLVTAVMEYDGLILYTVALHRVEGTPPPVLERLWVDIPLDPQECFQLIANGGGWNFRNSYDVRFIPAGTGSVWNSHTSKPTMERGVGYGSFLPQIWVGGDRVGLSISGENDRGWTPDKEIPAQELIREGDALIFRMNVVTRPVTVETERAFAFILLPTPSKPAPSGWRAWNRTPRGVPIERYENIDDFDGYPLTSRRGDMKPLTFQVEPASWEDAEYWAAIGRAKAGPGNPVLKYLNYSWPSFGPSIRPWVKDGVGAGGRIAWGRREVEDYFVWVANEYLRRGLVDGFYFDDVSLGRTLLLDAGAYEWENPETGKVERRFGFNTMGFRRFLQRVWKIMARQGKPPRLCLHMTWCFELPAFSFCEATLNGEDRDLYAFNPNDSMGHWSAAELRIMGNSEKWGLATFWKWGIAVDPPGGISSPKPQDRVNYWMYRQRRASDAWIPIHDFGYFWGDSGLRGPFAAFGLGDAEWIPHWKATGLVYFAEVSNVVPASVLCTVWRRNDRALLMISNVATTDALVTVSVSPSSLWPDRAGEKLVWRDETPDLVAPPFPTSAPAVTVPDRGNEKEAEIQQFVTNFLQESEGTSVEKEIRRLAVKVEDGRITLVVRARDYRLLRADRQGGQP